MPFVSNGPNVSTSLDKYAGVRGSHPMGETMAATSDSTSKPKEFRDRLIALRTARGWSQSELARRAKMEPSAINKLESGSRRNPGWKTVAALAKALDVDPQALMPGASLPEDDQPTRDEVRPAGAEVQVGRTHSGELLQLYLGSPLALEDQPTAEELHWLAHLGVLIWSGSPPTAQTVRAILVQRRAGKL